MVVSHTSAPLGSESLHRQRRSSNIAQKFYEANVREVLQGSVFDDRKDNAAFTREAVRRLKRNSWIDNMNGALIITKALRQAYAVRIQTMWRRTHRWRRVVAARKVQGAYRNHYWGKKYGKDVRTLAKNVTAIQKHVRAFIAQKRAARMRDDRDERIRVKKAEAAAEALAALAAAPPPEQEPSFYDAPEPEPPVVVVEERELPVEILRVPTPPPPEPNHDPACAALLRPAIDEAIMGIAAPMLEHMITQWEALMRLFLRGGFVAAIDWLFTYFERGETYFWLECLYNYHLETGQGKWGDVRWPDTYGGGFVFSSAGWLNAAPLQTLEMPAGHGIDAGPGCEAGPKQHIIRPFGVRPILQGSAREDAEAALLEHERGRGRYTPSGPPPSHAHAHAPVPPGERGEGEESATAPEPPRTPIMRGLPPRTSEYFREGGTPTKCGGFLPARPTTSAGGVSAGPGGTGARLLATASSSSHSHSSSGLFDSSYSSGGRSSTASGGSRGSSLLHFSYSPRSHLDVPYGRSNMRGAGHRQVGSRTPLSSSAGKPGGLGDREERERMLLTTSPSMPRASLPEMRPSTPSSLRRGRSPYAKAAYGLGHTTPGGGGGYGAGRPATDYNKYRHPSGGGREGGGGGRNMLRDRRQLTEMQLSLTNELFDTIMMAQPDDLL